MNKAQRPLNSIKTSGHSVFVISATTLVVILFGFLLLNELAGEFKGSAALDSTPSSTAIQLRDLRAREAAALSSYKILDEAQGIVQIPIERAMQLVVDEGVSGQFLARETIL